MPSLGWRPDPEDRRDYPARMQLPRLETALPQKHSVRAAMTPVRDQGQLGSCVGFACAALKEFQESQQRPHTPFRDVSEMWIYWRAKAIDIWPNEEGTSIRDALSVLATSGVPTEQGWPYTDQRTPKNRAPTRPAFWAGMVARWGKIGAYYRLTDLNVIKEWLFLFGPVVIGVPVGDTIFEPIARPGAEGRSFVSLPRTFSGGHAITLTGYDDQHRLLQFKNSWGPTWGYNGYGYLGYDYLERAQYDAWAIRDA